MKERTWLIIKKNSEPNSKFFSIELGWGNRDAATHFTDEEKQRFSELKLMPECGDWLDEQPQQVDKIFANHENDPGGRPCRGSS